MQAEAEGASLSCAGTENGDKYNIKIVLTLGSGMWANPMSVSLVMAVKHRATDDERHAIELRALETTFERRVAEAAAEVAARLENRVEAESRETTSMLRALKQKVAKLQTQMNNRVFFGEFPSPAGSCRSHSRALLQVRT